MNECFDAQKLQITSDFQTLQWCALLHCEPSSQDLQRAGMSSWDDVQGRGGGRSKRRGSYFVHIWRLRRVVTLFPDLWWRHPDSEERMSQRYILFIFRHKLPVAAAYKLSYIWFFETSTLFVEAYRVVLGKCPDSPESQRTRRCVLRPCPSWQDWTEWSQCNDCSPIRQDSPKIKF